MEPIVPVSAEGEEEMKTPRYNESGEGRGREAGSKIKGKRREKGKKQRKVAEEQRRRGGGKKWGSRKGGSSRRRSEEKKVNEILKGGYMRGLQIKGREQTGEEKQEGNRG